MLKRRIYRRAAALTLTAINFGMLAGCVNMPFDRQVFLPVALVEVMLMPDTAAEVKEQEARRKAQWEKELARQDAEQQAKGVRQAQRITSALKRYRREGTARPPEHGSALVAAGVLKPEDFIAPGSDTLPSHIVVGNTNLAALATLPAAERWAAVRAEADLLPPNVVAHRVGDIVFVYHGVKPALDACGKGCPVPESEIWWVVIAPACDVFKSPPRPNSKVWLGATKGKAIQHQQFASTTYVRGEGALAEQNRLRESLGLCWLPDPSFVQTNQYCPVGWLSAGQSELGRLDRDGW